MTFRTTRLVHNKSVRMSFRRSVLDLPRRLADCNQPALFSAVALQKCEKDLMFDVSLSNWFHVYFAVKHAVTLLLYHHVSFVWAFSSMHVEVTAQRSARRPTAQALTCYSSQPTWVMLYRKLPVLCPFSSARLDIIFLIIREEYRLETAWEESCRIFGHE